MTASARISSRTPPSCGGVLIGALPSVWIVAALLFALPVQAHVTSTGAATLDILDASLRYRLVVAATEIENEAGRLLYHAGQGQPQATERVGEFARRFATFAVDGQPCRPEEIAIRELPSPDHKIAVEMTLACVGMTTGTLTIRDDWPEVFGGHFQTIMSVGRPGKSEIQLVFVETRRQAAVELAEPAPTHLLYFVVMGVEHMLGGLDHLLFLLALLATARGFWRVVGIVTGFTIGHSVTLSLATLGLVDVPGRIVEPLIAASIVWVAVENLVAPGGSTRRWVAATAFGLLHGLGFASALLDLDLSGAVIVRALVGFNVGVELGQLVFVALFVPLLVWLAKSERLARLPQTLSVAVAATGFVWFIGRVV